MATNYRKIYENYHDVKIPRGMHIHHIDGNRENNNPLNLQMVTPEEHWNLHLTQGDIVALRGKFIQGASEAGKLGGPIGGRANKGKKHSKETKEKMSKWQIGRKFSEATKKKMSESRPDISGKNNPFYGKQHSEETKQKISQSKLGKKQTLEHIKKVADKLRGKPRSEEIRQKISKKLKGRQFSEETRKKMSDAHKGKIPWNKGNVCQ